MAKGIYPPSVQPGIPRLTEPPKGWARVTYGEILREVQRPVKLDDEKEYQLVVAKRSRGGIEPRERLLGKKILTKTQFEIKAQDFLVSNRQIVHGACGIVPQHLNGSVVSNEYTVLHANDALDLTFLNHFTNSIFFQQTCFHASVGVDVEKMIFRIAEWFKMELNLPPLEEQKKIAEILSTWDRAIDLAAKKVNLQEQWNHTFLQTLSVDYDQLSIGELAEKIEGGGTPDRNTPEFWDGPIAWATVKDLVGKNLSSTQESITELGLRSSSAKLVPSSVPIMATRMAVGKVARFSMPVAINQDLKAIYPDRTKVDSQYFFFALQTRQKQIESASSGSTVKGIRLEHLRDISIPVPSIDQQVKLGVLLHDSDQQLEFLRARLDLLKGQKQGLMQKLLTGKVRVKV